MNGYTQGGYLGNVVDNLDQAIHRLYIMRELIKRYFVEATSSDIEPDRKVEAELALRGVLLLYESIARPLASYISHVREVPQEYISDRHLPRFAIALEGDWISHELSRFLGSLNYLYNVIAVSHKTRSQEGSYRLHIPETRSHIFRNAHLYYYLDRHEELRIYQIHMASPGLVEFIMSHYEHGALMVSLIVLISKAPKFIDSLITVWNRFKDVLRDQRRRDRNEELERKIHDFFIEHVLPRFRDTDPSLDMSAIKMINKAITDFSKMKLADPIAATDNVLRAFAVLAHLYSVGKFHVIDINKENE